MARTHLFAAIMALWVGCSAAARVGITTGSRASAAPEQRFPGQILQRQVAELVGLTVDQARQKLRQFGHDGAVKVVRLDKHMSGCALERVCNVGPTFSFSVHDEVQLWLNPKLDIAAPEP